MQRPGIKMQINGQRNFIAIDCTAKSYTEAVTGNANDRRHPSSIIPASLGRGQGRSTRGTRWTDSEYLCMCVCVEGLSKWTLVVECVLRAYRMETKWTDGLKAEPQTPTLITAVIQNFCVFNNLYLGNELEESFRSWHHHR